MCDQEEERERGGEREEEREGRREKKRGRRMRDDHQAGWIEQSTQGVMPSRQIRSDDDDDDLVGREWLS